jgi:hypothetical protein
MAERPTLDEIIAGCVQDPDARRRFKDNPKRYLSEKGVDVPEEAEIVVLENTSRKFHVALPAPPGSELGDQELDAVAGGASTTTANPSLTRLRQFAAFANRGGFGDVFDPDPSPPPDPDPLTIMPNPTKGTLT